MDKQHFDQLVKGVREMKRHMAGKSVRGARTTELPEPDVRTIRDPYSGEELAAFPAIHPDVAVIHALQADKAGNALIGGNQGLDPELAFAARTVIVTAEQVVERLDKADLVSPVVSAVVEAPNGAWPTSCHPLYPVAGGEILRYIDACGREEFEAYLQERLAR